MTQRWDYTGTNAVEPLQAADSFPDYTSYSVNVTQAYGNLHPKTGRAIYNIVAQGPDGGFGIATTDVPQAQEFLHLLQKLQEEKDFMIRHEAAAAAVKKGTEPARRAKQMTTLAEQPKALLQRVGDPEKDHTLKILNDALTYGYLTRDEFGIRSDKALAAQSQPVLNGLIADLKNMQPHDEDTSMMTIRRTEFNGLQHDVNALRKLADKRLGAAMSFLVTSILLALFTVLFVAGVM